VSPIRWLASVACLSAALATGLAASSEDALEGRRIVEVLRLAPGMAAADVGAGAGKFTTILARGVGASGRVYATEIAQDKLDEVEQNVKAEGIANVLTVLGDQQRTGLPRECCDRVLLRLVYHHFAEPQAMQRSLWDALRPGGLIAVVDVPPKKSWPAVAGAPDRGGHGIEAKELVADMSRAGFEVVAQHDDWPAETDSYCVVFRRPAKR
jgi:tRNA A58 N-methylase Trm61